MCAVSGVLLLPGRGVSEGAPPAALRAALREAVERMNRVLSHRGPDDATLYEDGGVVLGHRRLSIIDLSGGRQPIGNEDGSVQVVFNGEIYNYRELTALLRGRGHVFRTRCDTEVIVHAYEEWGTEALSRLRGMFAFALYDRAKGRVLLCRDPVGEKPLYYHVGSMGRQGGAGEGPMVLSFASEAKGILVLPWVHRTVDPAGIADYLRYRYVAAPRTAFAGIHKLPAGTYVSVSLRSVCDDMGPVAALPVPTPYWHLSYRPKLNAGRRLLDDIVEEFLDEAVASRLLADVPLGVLLSGGVDSTLVLAFMRRHLSKGSLLSFCAGFADPAADERLEAAIGARALQAEHREICVEREVLSTLPRLLWHLDEPLGDPSIMPTFCVAELAARHVKAALTGDGGDEAFAGYERYRRSRISDLLRALPYRPHGLMLRVLGMISRRLPGELPDQSVPHLATRLATRIAESQRAAESPLPLLFQETMSAFSAREVAGLLHRDARALAQPALESDRVAALFESADAEHYLDRFLYTDLRSYLADDLMVKTDRMTMAHGLEARAPFLDTGLLALAAALPVSFKRPPGGLGKQVLRRIAGRILPAPLSQRVREGRKRGFTPPLSAWLLSSARQVDDVLRHPTLVEAGVLDGQAFAAAAGGGHKGPGNASDGMDRRFLLLLLELWHRVVVLEQRDVRSLVAA